MSYSPRSTPSWAGITFWCIRSKTPNTDGLVGQKVRAALVSEYSYFGEWGNLVQVLLSSLLVQPSALGPHSNPEQKLMLGLRTQARCVEKEEISQAGRRREGLQVSLHYLHWDLWPHNNFIKNLKMLLQNFSNLMTQRKLMQQIKSYVLRQISFHFY